MPYSRNQWNGNCSSKWMWPHQQKPMLFHFNRNVNSIHNQMQWMKIRRQHRIRNVNEWSNHRVNYQWYSHYRRSKKGNGIPSWQQWSMWIKPIGWFSVMIHHCSKRQLCSFRRPMYLKESSNILIQSLRQHLNHTLKKRTEQRYLYLRLQLLDRQFHLGLDRCKWQLYFDLGSQHQLWPVRIHHATCLPGKTPYWCEHRLKYM